NSSPERQREQKGRKKRTLGVQAGSGQNEELQKLQHPSACTTSTREGSEEATGSEEPTSLTERSTSSGLRKLPEPDPTENACWRQTVPTRTGGTHMDSSLVGIPGLISVLNQTEQGGGRPGSAQERTGMQGLATTRALPTEMRLLGPSSPSWRSTMRSREAESANKGSLSEPREGGDYGLRLGTSQTRSNRNGDFEGLFGRRPNRGGDDQGSWRR
ncbi:hypothetical protein V5O48_015594, partial [Marasmius crinis-equi]